MQRSVSAEGKKKNAEGHVVLHGCAFKVWSPEGTKAERAGRNNGPSQMPCYVSGLFEFTIVKATIVRELPSFWVVGGKQGPHALKQVPREQAVTLQMRPITATQEKRARLLLTPRWRCVTVCNCTPGCFQLKKQ